MIRSEFDEWFKYHCRAFPGVASWFAKPESVPEPQETVAMWAEALADVNIDSAKKATDLLFRGTEPPPPGYSSHPRAVRRIAREIDHAAYNAQREPITSRRPQVVDGQVCYHCAECQDTGVRTVLSPACVRRILQADGVLEDCNLAKGVTTVVACDCAIGELKTRDRRYPVCKALIPGLAVYDARCMMLYDPLWNPQTLVDAVMDRYRPKQTGSLWVDDNHPGG
jgi:hypothetical protein